MTATDNLGLQFRRMAISRAMRLPSVDMIDTGHSRADQTVSASLGEKMHDVENDDYLQEVSNNIRKEGQTVPVHIGRAEDVMNAYHVGRNHPARSLYTPDELMMGDGHHRLAMMHSQGMKTIKYTDSKKLAEG